MPPFFSKKMTPFLASYPLEFRAQETQTLDYNYELEIPFWTWFVERG